MKTDPSSRPPWWPEPSSVMLCPVCLSGGPWKSAPHLGLFPRPDTMDDKEAFYLKESSWIFTHCVWIRGLPQGTLDAFKEERGLPSVCHPQSANEHDSFRDGARCTSLDGTELGMRHWLAWGSSPRSAGYILGAPVSRQLSRSACPGWPPVLCLSPFSWGEGESGHTEEGMSSLSLGASFFRECWETQLPAA